MFTFSGGAGTSTPTPTTATGTTEEVGVTDEQANATQKKLKRMALAYKQYSVQVQANSEAAAQAITGMVDKVLSEGIMRLGEGLVTGKAAFSDFGTFLLATFSSTAEQLGKLAITVGFAVEGIKKALQSLNPIAAIAAGIALLALAGVARGQMRRIAEGNNNQVKLAKGGLAFGESLAVVGDNPNARFDPEVIAPLSKLKDMLGEQGGQSVEVFGRISGEDILLSSERSSKRRTRYRGF